MKKYKILKIISFILIVVLFSSLNFGVGLAPITIVGYIDNLDISDIKTQILKDSKILNHSLNMIIEETEINNDSKLKYALIMGINDTINDLNINIDFKNNANDTLYRKEIQQVSAWSIINLNLSLNKNNEINKENIKIQTSRPNSLNNELEINEHLHQIKIRNQTYIDKNFEVIIIDNLDEVDNQFQKLKEKNIEEPSQFNLKLITQDNNYMIIIVLAIIIMLQFTSLILHRKKKKN